MLDKINAFIARIRVRWSVVLTALTVALPYALEYAGYINITPLLAYYLGDQWALALTPLVVALLTSMKSALHLEPQED